MADILRNQYHIELEMSGADYATAIVSCFDTEDGLNRLQKAILEIDKGLVKEKTEANHTMFSWNLPDVRMKMADAMEADFETLAMQLCAQRISGEFIYLYPPGIPIVAPGEAVTEEILKKVMEYKRMGLPVQGMADKKAESLHVIIEE